MSDGAAAVAVERRTPGKRFRDALVEHKPLQILGAINAYSALIAERCGAHALYLSGSGVAVASHGLPDLGITNLNDVAEDVRRIAYATKLPLLVDIDTGFGSAFGIARTIHSLMTSGAAAVHMEDQVAAKRCGHRPGKQLVSREEMVDRIKAAVHGRDSHPDVDPDFFIIARTDAIAVEGLDAALVRAQAYLDAGADAIFAEACTEIGMYTKFKELKDKNGDAAKILANLTEFGKTPLYTREELKDVDVDMALYPLSAHRAMCKAAELVYRTILTEGTQKSVLDAMQTRAELYDFLDYHKYEKSLDDLFEKQDDNECKEGSKS